LKEKIKMNPLPEINAYSISYDARVVTPSMVSQNPQKTQKTLIINSTSFDESVTAIARPIIDARREEDTAIACWRAQVHSYDLSEIPNLLIILWASSKKIWSN
jgi:hypothetical protein